MHYKTPGKMEKHRIVDTLGIRLYQETKRWMDLKKVGGRQVPRRVKVVYNLFSGKFKTIYWKATPKKNEIVVIDQFPGEWLVGHVEQCERSPLNGWIWSRKVAKMELCASFYKAALELAPNAYRNVEMLAAERCLEIANKRRSEE